jgi:hypothetical protein
MTSSLFDPAATMICSHHDGDCTCKICRQMARTCQSGLVCAFVRVGNAPCGDLCVGAVADSSAEGLDSPREDALRQRPPVGRQEKSVAHRLQMVQHAMVVSCVPPVTCQSLLAHAQLAVPLASSLATQATVCPLLRLLKAFKVVDSWTGCCQNVHVVWLKCKRTLHCQVLLPALRKLASTGSALKIVVQTHFSIAISIPIVLLCNLWACN